ncbi:hypothetical protein Ctu_1p01280 (plasmid) [Cronobacter turicensis z3032]|uniref:Uncharacterized protein n=1 Tax=Cronobacter turicensis (strain DSM 18703 / CCUG 55852 / LMG 23827 / z3032) TaxID=693216 RepID=C9Y5M0_CROTZ|nr:hypothetical protein Ctu_1p01280 [Cronobacter turicensis z3032]
MLSVSFFFSSGHIFHPGLMSRGHDGIYQDTHHSADFFIKEDESLFFIQGQPLCQPF